MIYDPYCTRMIYPIMTCGCGCGGSAACGLRRAAAIPPPPPPPLPTAGACQPCRAGAGAGGAGRDDIGPWRVGSGAGGGAGGERGACLLLLHSRFIHAPAVDALEPVVHIRKLIIISLERPFCVARPSFSLTVGSSRAQDAEWSRLGAESLRARLRSLSAQHATSREDLR